MFLSKKKVLKLLKNKTQTHKKYKKRSNQKKNKYNSFRRNKRKVNLRFKTLKKRRTSEGGAKPKRKTDPKLEVLNNDFSRLYNEYKNKNEKYKSADVEMLLDKTGIKKLKDFETLYNSGQNNDIEKKKQLVATLNANKLAKDREPAPEVAVEERREEPAVEPALEERREEPAVEPAVEERREEPAVEPAVEERREEPAVEERREEPAVEERREEPAVEPAVEERREDPAIEPAVEERREDPAIEPAAEERREEPAIEPAAEERREEPAIEPALEERREEPIGELTPEQITIKDKLTPLLTDDDNGEIWNPDDINRLSIIISRGTIYHPEIPNINNLDTRLANIIRDTEYSEWAQDYVSDIKEIIVKTNPSVDWPENRRRTIIQRLRKLLNNPPQMVGDQPPAVEVREGDQPPAVEVREGDQPPALEVREEDQPPALEVREEDQPPAVEVREEDQPPAVEVREEDQPPAVVVREEDQPPAVVVREEDQPPAVVVREEYQPPAVVVREEDQPPAVVVREEDGDVNEYQPETVPETTPGNFSYTTTVAPLPGNMSEITIKIRVPSNAVSNLTAQGGNSDEESIKDIVTTSLFGGRKTRQNKKNGKKQKKTIRKRK
jgi:hypothetical protein